jgi:hypothetical protein
MGGYHPRSKTYSRVLPCGLLFSSSASSESIGSSSPTWPDVITMSALAGSLLSATMLPAAKYFVELLRISWWCVSETEKTEIQCWQTLLFVTNMAYAHNP